MTFTFTFTTSLFDLNGLPVKVGDTLYYDPALQGWSMYGAMNLTLEWDSKKHRLCLRNDKHSVAWDVSAEFVSRLTLVQ